MFFKTVILKGIINNFQIRVVFYLVIYREEKSEKLSKLIYFFIYLLSPCKFKMLVSRTTLNKKLQKQ